MALESASFINQLNPANPASTDSVSQADDHLRLIKAAIKATFPNITGAVTKTQGELNNVLEKTGGTLTGPLVLPGAPTESLQASTKAYVDTAVAGSFPSGGIIMWSGSIASIPSGWALCNGLNGTPDLRNRFVVAAGSTYAVGATGGSADAIVVSHTHTATSTSTVTDPGHFHDVQGGSSGSYQPGGGYGASFGTNGNDAGDTKTKTTGITVATSTSIASTGSSGTNANLPPYYALAYIMKV
jgi:microcystin-dependent protein